VDLVGSGRDCLGWGRKEIQMRGLKELGQVEWKKDLRKGRQQVLSHSF
jgi:hypothetical protein